MKLSRAVKKTILYRSLSMGTEVLVVYAFTSSLEAIGATAVVCLIVHTALYYLIEKRYDVHGC